MPRFIKRLVIVLAVIILIAVGTGLWLSGKYTVPIMMYHSVNTVKQESWIPMVTPDYFDRHMAFLKENGYNVISLDELVEKTKLGGGLPRNSVVITFDDGYEDNYSIAFETLKEHQFPATIFVPSAKIGQKGRLTWSQLREMSKNDIIIASHTHSEKYLLDLSEKEQEQDVVLSKQVLTRGIGRNINYLSYPIGGFNDTIKEIVKNAGYKGACATNRGYDRFNKDVFELNRIRFGNKDNSDIILKVKLSGYYNLFRKLKNPY